LKIWKYNATQNGVSFETSFDSKQPKLEPKLVSALSETKHLFRLFRFYTETESFDVSIEPKQTEDQPKQFDREHIFLFFYRNASIPKQRVSMFWLNQNKQKTHIVIPCLALLFMIHFQILWECVMCYCAIYLWANASYCHHLNEPVGNHISWLECRLILWSAVSMQNITVSSPCMSMSWMNLYCKEEVDS